MFEINMLAAAGGAVPFDDESAKSLIYFGKHFFNLAVLAGALFYFLGKPVSAFMKSRRERMSARFDESQKKLREARKLFEESSARIANLKSETDALKSSIAEQAETERQAILRRADKEREAILRESSESFGFEVAKAKSAVRKEAVSMVMKIAEQSLRASGDGGRTDSVKNFTTLLEEGKWLRSQN